MLSVLWQYKKVLRNIAIMIGLKARNSPNIPWMVIHYQPTILKNLYLAHIVHLILSPFPTPERDGVMDL